MQYQINTPHHNETVQADSYKKDDRGDLYLYNATRNNPIGRVPVENLEGIFEAGALR